MFGIGVVVEYVATAVVGFTLLYVFTLTFLGIRVTHRNGVSLPAQERLLGADEHRSRQGSLEEDPGPVRDYHLYVLLPCLNEAAVIGPTIESVSSVLPRATVVVVNDASEDETAAIARSYGERVVVVDRRLPEARHGKGEALNAGIAVIRADAAARGRDPRKVIVCVMDADGRLTPGALDAVAPVFDDPAVGGVQLVVRIRNRDSLMLRFQDMEFWAMSGVGQLGRVLTNTVSMGGNGQFTRLYALDEIGERPWSRSLTEDLDLGISLSVRGWKTLSTPGAYVTQQGVDDVNRLIRQRSRWYQGHMMAIQRLPELFRSRHLGNLGLFELGCYLAVPWLITLPWSIIQQYLLLQTLMGNGLPSHLVGGAPVVSRLAYLVLWYLISFAPHLFWGLLYWRRAEEVTLRRALLMCHLMIPWSYISYAAAWTALGRIVAGRRGWVKTARSNESTPSEAVAAGERAFSG